VGIVRHSDIAVYILSLRENVVVKLEES
jgi:hypothetical protein